MTKDQIKEHVREHKALYIVGSLGVVAGFTWVVMRGRHASILSVLDGSDAITVRPLSFLFRSTQNVITTVEREGRGHPGYIVRCLETGDVYTSQAEAARHLAIYPNIISDHLRGKFPDAKGLHFERLSPNVAQAIAG